MLGKHGGFTKKCNLTWLTIETWWSYHRKKGIWWDLTEVVLFHDGLWQGQNTGHHSSWRPFFSSNIRDVTTGWIPWSSRFMEVSIVVPKNGWFMSWKIPSKNDDYILFLWFPTGCSVSFRQFAGSYLVYFWLAQEIGIYETDLNQPVANWDGYSSSYSWNVTW